MLCSREVQIGFWYIDILYIKSEKGVKYIGKYETKSIKRCTVIKGNTNLIGTS